MNEAIKQTLDSKGWLLIEEMLKEDFLDGKKPLRFKTDGKSNEQIATEMKAKEYSAKSVKSFLNKLNRIKNEDIKEKKSYI